MNHLDRRAACRSAITPLTPDYVCARAPLPGMRWRHGRSYGRTRAAGAALTQYTVEFEPGGSLGPAATQRFLYVLRARSSCRTEGRNIICRLATTPYLPDGSSGLFLLWHRAPRRGDREGLSAAAWVRAPKLLLGDEDSVPGEPPRGRRVAHRAQTSAGGSVLRFPPSTR